MIRRQHYDFILVSKHLLDMTGIDFAGAVRKERNNTVSGDLVLLTSDNIVNCRMTAKQAGYLDVLPKNNFEALYSGLLRMAGSNPRTRPSRVLYIEDTRSVASYTVSLMEKMDLQVDHFTNGEEALQAFDENDYELVVTDIFIAGQYNGVDITDRIRQHHHRKNRTPVLAVSGQSDLAMRLKALHKGANDFINSPIQEDEFKARINNLIALKKLFNQVDEQQKRLFDLAMTDQLTGLYNRRRLMEMAPKYLSDALRHKFEPSLLVIDLDHFKHINDSHGHATGDTILFQIGRLLNQVCRKEDFAARFGGEEFVMLLSHCGRSDALEKAEQLRKQIESLHPADIHITASIGITSTDHGRTSEFDRLFEEADKAVYLAKNGGRNQGQGLSADNLAA